MDSMIREIVQEEVQKCMQTSNSNQVNGNQTATANQRRPTVLSNNQSENQTGNTSRREPSTKVQSRLTNLLTKIRRGKGERKEKFKEVKIQVRWERVDFDGNVELVKPSQGGGCRFIVIEKEEDPDFQTLGEQAMALYFPEDVNLFSEHVDNVKMTMLDQSHNEVNLSAFTVRDLPPFFTVYD